MLCRIEMRIYVCECSMMRVRRSCIAKCGCVANPCSPGECHNIEWNTHTFLVCRFTRNSCVPPLMRDAPDIHPIFQIFSTKFPFEKQIYMHLQSSRANIRVMRIFLRITNPPIGAKCCAFDKRDSQHHIHIRHHTHTPYS